MQMKRWQEAIMDKKIASQKEGVGTDE